MLEENTTINAHIARNLYRKLVLHTLSINILLNQMVETDPSIWFMITHWNKIQYLGVNLTFDFG